jgi:hypothetical protein
MRNFTNYTYNSTYANFSSTIMSDEFREYLDNQMFIPLIVLSWLFLITNHKYRQSLKAFESFKAQSADEIFFLQDSLARDDTTDENSIITDTLCPCCANAASTALPMSLSIAERPRKPQVVANPDRAVYALSIPFSVLSDAVENYSQFHKTSIMCVSLDDVLCSSAGIKGWAEHRSEDIPTKTRETTTKKVKKQKQKQKPSEYNLFLKKSIADIKRDNPGIQHQLAFLQATKKWQSRKA